MSIHGFPLCVKTKGLMVGIELAAMASLAFLHTSRVDIADIYMVTLVQTRNT